MRIAIAIILIILWFLAILGGYAVGATVDLLLVVAVLLLVVELRRGRYHRDSASDHVANPDGAAGVTARPGAVARADDLTVVVHSDDDTDPSRDDEGD